MMILLFTRQNGEMFCLKVVVQKVLMHLLGGKILVDWQWELRMKVLSILAAIHYIMQLVHIKNIYNQRMGITTTIALDWHHLDAI
jgi:hypothetical protein